MGQEGLVADDEPATAGVPERSAEDLMDVEHRLRREASSVAAAVVEERLVEGIKIRSAHAVQRDVADEWVDAGEDLALVAAERGRAQARPASRQPGRGQINRQGHAAEEHRAASIARLDEFGEQPLGFPAVLADWRLAPPLLAGQRIGALVHNGVVPAALLHQVAPHDRLLLVGEARDRATTGRSAGRKPPKPEVSGM
jgi:hypothetical protein